MQDTNNEKFVLQRQVIDNVASHRVTSQSGRELLTRPANIRLVCKDGDRVPEGSPVNCTLTFTPSLLTKAQGVREV